jgi:hypothetical protein
MKKWELPSEAISHYANAQVIFSEAMSTQASAKGPGSPRQFNKDINYRDQHGYSSDEYLSAGVDQIPILYGHTVVECY